MSTGAIYIITNKITKKQYVGQSTQPNTRWVQHKSCKPGVHLANSIHKHGIDAFSFEILGYTDTMFLDSFEKYWIHKLDTLNSGYNMTEGGGGGLTGFTHSAKTKAQMSKNNCMRNPAIAKKNGAIRQGQKLTDKQRAACSVARLKYFENGGVNSTQGKTWKVNLSEDERKRKYGRHGEDHHLYGIGHTEKSKLKMKQSHAQTPKQKCKYCSMETTPSNISRWHNENCKNKKGIK